MTQRLGRQLLNEIQRDRSRSTIDKMMREARFATVIMMTIMLLFSAIILGNSFDYAQSVHYVPAVCYCLIAGIGLFFLSRHTWELSRITLHSGNLYQTLTDLIRLRSQHTKLMVGVWLGGMLAGSLIMFPTVARKFEDQGLAGILLSVGLPLCLVLIALGLAKITGFFTDRYLNELREQVNELEELR
ncbi:hypothetical protein [Spirosoma endophyticum]|nr:hypothetical protein [Spirosoma endophyticum]